MQSFFKATSPELASILQEDGKEAPVSTRVVCTIGGATNDVDTLSELLQEGMTVRRECRPTLSAFHNALALGGQRGMGGPSQRGGHR